MDPAEYRLRIDDWINTFRGSRPAENSAGVLVPGDPERRAEAERSVHGVPLPPAVIADLQEVGERVGVTL
jgi:LDH2 family malate/lactate/ureidoglycolate dehydrogenase